MKYNFLKKQDKTLKIGIYSAYFPNLDKKFTEYQKKVFDKFNLEINQIEIQPNMLGRGFNSHGTLLTELSKNEEVDYLIFFDADAIPLHSNFLNIVIDRVYGKNTILGIEQKTNHIPNSIPYAGPSCFVISKETYNILGQPNYNETSRSDVAEELTHICREKNIPVDMFKFEMCEVPLWDLDNNRKFGIASQYEGLVFHNFESRQGEHTHRFVNICRKVLEEKDLQIVIHTLPHEIDQLEQLLIRLKYNSIYLNENNVLIDVVLNLNLIDWNLSSIPKSFFINKFKQLEQLTKTWADTKFEINEDGSIQGCVSHRRKAFKETKADALLILDTDIYFNETLLYYITNAVKTLNVENPYYILTPQTTPMWDNSWDLIVTDKYKNDGIHFQSRDPYKYIQQLGEITIKPIQGFKFGGGWATTISTPLAKKIEIPESLGHYGLEDTYIMMCSQMLQNSGHVVMQYIIENEIIVEDHLFRFNPYKEYLHTINKQDEFRKIANDNFQKELVKFGNTLKI